MFLLKRLLVFTFTAFLLLAGVVAFRLDHPIKLEDLLRRESMDSFAGDYLAARFALENQDIKEARTFLESALEKSPHDRSLQEETIEFYVSEGLPEKGLTLAEDYIVNNPYPIKNPHLLLAMQAAKEGNFVDAQGVLFAEDTEGETEDFPTLNSEVVVPLVNVWVKVGLGQLDAAIKDLDTLKDSIALPLIQFQAALIHEMAGNDKKAETEYDALIQSAAHSLRVAQAAHKFYMRIAKPEKAIEVLEAYLLNNPSAVEQNLFENPAAEYPITTAQQGLADLLMEIASFLSLSDQEKRSLFYARLSVFLKPDFPHAKLMLANILRNMDRHQDAIYAYKQISSPPAFSWQARMNITRMYGELKEFDKAKSLLLSMAEEDKKSPDPYLTLADILMEKKEFTQAAEFYTRALERVKEIQSHHWVVYYARGICYERAKQWEKAEIDLKKALELNPGQPDVMNYLAYSWLVMDRNIEQAFSMLKKAVEERPSDAHIIDSYGWALFKMGQYKKALAYLEKANEMMPHDPTTNDHLGDVYWHLGRKREAAFQWKRALYFKPEPEEILTIEKKLAHGLPLPEVTLSEQSSPKKESKQY